MKLPMFAKQKEREAKARKIAGSELEKAKTVLRRRGQVVYEAWVVGGPRGLIYVDGELRRPEQVIEAASN